MIQVEFKAATWFIEKTNSFETIKPKKYLQILNMEIQCKKTLVLIRSIMKGHCVELEGGIAQKAMIGSPQRGLSRLLCDIYLHQLDKYMANLSNDFDMANSKKAKTRKLRAVDLLNPDFVRVRYVRYADEFLISVIGSHQVTEKIKDRVSKFLKDELALKIQAKITPASREKAFFLGTYIQCRQSNAAAMCRIVLEAPMDKLIEKLIRRDFIYWNSRGNRLHTKAPTGLVNFEHEDIILYYNTIISGILNYYSFAHNRGNLGTIVRYLHMSCAHTLASKYKLGSRAKNYKKFYL